MTVAAAFVCLAGGTVAAALLLAMPWVLLAPKLVFFFVPWLALTWIGAMLGSLALLGYGVAVLTQGAASLTAVFLYTGFLIALTVSVAAAPRLLMLRYTQVASSLRAHYMGMVLLVTYAALVFLWVPGTLMAALTPLLAMIVTSGTVILARQNTKIVNNPTPNARATPRKDGIYWALLVFVALGPLVDWALCLAGARDFLWPLFLLVHVVAVCGYLAALPV